MSRPLRLLLVEDVEDHLGRGVIAEGIEDARTLEMLKAADCDAAQGFHIGRALDEEALATWLAESPFGPESRRSQFAERRP